MVAVSFKAYLGYAQTLAWVRNAVPLISEHPRVEVVVFPSLTTLAPVVQLLQGRAVAGAQKISTKPAGAFTGETPASVVAECGGRYAEVAHAERRGVFGEGDDVFREEIAAAVAAGLTPLVCVGERSRGGSGDAVAECLSRIEALDVPAGSVVAYEPEWAIGADDPAPPEHVKAVLSGIRQNTGRAHRLLYGGTAGPGTFAALSGAADGLFLGRRAHDVRAFGAVLHEITTTMTGRNVDAHVS
ncbi:triose-phosphate isomerase family protein [Puerhibacterium sp. TATVAM-FAB25]|uniref:triose-phosphate isomerase family protein n=1 Tax=Puerhibacterium sp. TATVAM-FAB25 TaxID=3093699 RepID=UPI00397ACC70